MRTKLTIIVVVLAARMCRGDIIIGSSIPDKSTARLVDDLVNIVRSCYKGQINNGVGLVGHLPTGLLKRLSIQHSIPVALVDDYGNINEKIHQKDLQFRWKLNVFVVGLSPFHSADNYTQMIRNIKRSIWWNHMASFFILDTTPDCIYAVRCLSIAWNNDLLNAKVMCSHHKSGRIIFSYNPFTSQAPILWKQVLVDSLFKKQRENPHPLTVFSQNYRDNQSICAGLDFDKTQDIGGYTILLEGLSKNYSESLRKSNNVPYGTYAYHSTRRNIVITILRAMNSTSRVCGPTNWDYVSIGCHMANVENWWFYTWSSKERMATYPHRQVSVRIVTNFRGYRTQLNEIANIFDTASLVGLFVVYLFTMMFFKFFVRQTVSTAALNLIRMTCSLGFSNLPDNTVARIFLTSLFLFALATMAVFQSNTTVLLSTQISLPHAHSIQALEDLGYNQVCANAFLNKILKNSWLRNALYGRLDFDCMKRVKNDPLVAAAIIVEEDGFDWVQTLDLRVSEEPLQSYYYTFNIQWNFPLTERINKIIARIVEADLLERWDVKCRPIKMSDFYMESTNANVIEYNVLNLHDMTFALTVLGIGLSCATVVFIIEVTVGYYNIRYLCTIKIWFNIL